MHGALVDAGPLIALADRSDRNHRRVAAYLRRFAGRLLTTWPVLTEVCHSLPERLQIASLRWAARGGATLIELDESALSTIAGWKERYADVPMDLAGASLLWAAQQTGVLQILTFDLKGFPAYRLPDGRALASVLQ